MIDIHCHILHGIDDGAKTLEDSLRMAEAAAKEGIRSIIATPHHKNGRYNNVKEEILKRVDELNLSLQSAQIDLTVLPGQETRIYGEILEDIEKNEILTLNNTGKYLFVELPSNHVPRYTDKLLYDIQVKGMTPVIVHPERNQEIIERPDLLYKLVRNGTLTQVTASSVAGYFGKKIKNFSLQLIDANLIHFVSSDAHNIENRSFKMLEALEQIRKKYGTDMVYYFTENAELLAEGSNVYRDIPEPIKKKKFLGIF
ncbi:tyrosine-protein phosphatase [Bacillus infantis]|uniref:tyrosine-protein phosphatase n=1 Tax=Bacillus infantis TaxID=324767 RepID=UPI0020A050D2|nr:CpsB/CapC family capsule biosynthesis tyrosine phosphatase [Bacillus infantis]MCP1160726.1 tyrosine protein phosphatase [Bacillus infantis]